MAATLRLATAAGAAAMAAIYAPFCTSSTVSFEETAPTPDEMAARVAKLAPYHPWFVLEINNTVAGYAYASPHRERAAYRWAVDVTVYVHPDHHRQGVGRALYAALFQVLALQGYRRAYAGVTLPNPGSEGLHEAVGFTEVGVYRAVGYKLGGWRDVRWYQRSLSDGQPGEILTVDEVRGSAGWEGAIRDALTLVRR